jgi:Regulated-SNARE-like domain
MVDFLAYVFFISFFHFYAFLFVAYCVVAVEAAGRQITIAFLERVKEEFTKKYSSGKAATATAHSLNKEYA